MAKKSDVNRNNAVELASAMVDAVSTAFMYGAPLPGDKLEVGGAPISSSSSARSFSGMPMRSEIA